MSDAQIFQIFSLMYLAVGIGILINSKFYKRIFEDFIERPSVLYIGGLGALIVGLSYNYVAYLVPWAAAGVNILIMIIILLIRPTGLFAAGK